jgi:hypothetical protein
MVSCAESRVIGGGVGGILVSGSVGSHVGSRVLGNGGVGFGVQCHAG